MKCTFFLFVALLVALALATSPLSPATGGSDIGTLQYSDISVMLQLIRSSANLKRLP
jgi:hypothetical protein